jgi:hypothetical protein
MMRPVRAALLTLLVFTALGSAVIRSSGPTFDEPVHLASGYTSLKQSVRLLNGMDHPPLAEMWAAVPLLALRPQTFFGHPLWISGRLYNYADHFLYKNNVDAGRMLAASRFFSLLTWGAVLAFVVTAWGGPWAGLLLALCPPLFSNAALVTTDAAPAALFILAFWLISKNRWVWAGAAIGAAMAAKFSMVVLPVLAVALTAREKRWKETALAAAAALGVLLLAYRGDLAAYWNGLTATLLRLGQGRGSFLLGEHHTGGVPQYFPLAVLVKTPLPFLAAAAFGAWRFRREKWLIAAPLAFFLLACFSKTQIGLRHVLPVYPFLAVLGGLGLSKLPRRAAWGLSAWLAAGVLWSGPHYIGYFNELAGGPAGGVKWLADSNLDWGQGLPALAAELRKRGNPAVYLSYFGTDDPSYHGIRYHPVAWYPIVDRREGLAKPGEPLLFAVSATNLQTVYFADHGVFDWLKARTPLAVPGGSIFLYDVNDPEGRAGLSRLLERDGQSGILAADEPRRESARLARGAAKTRRP